MQLTRTENGNALVDQLYNLEKDRGEKMNLAEKYSVRVKVTKVIVKKEKSREA